MNLESALLLVGCGKMGGALLDGWLYDGFHDGQVTVVEPGDTAAAAIAVRNVTVASSLDAVAEDFSPEVVVLAVKPQAMDAVLPGCARFVSRDTVFLSIAAGKTIGYFQKGLGEQASVVRAMPNTPAAVGRGITVLAASAQVSSAQKQLCEDLLSAVGETAWVDDEGMIDPVTAVSGGGPAYVFLLIECLAQAGVDAGLTEYLAMKLARVTVSGAGELVRQSNDSAATLRENVTSPGGTTLEALKVLMAEDGLQPLMTRAIAEATRRSRELAS